MPGRGGIGRAKGNFLHSRLAKLTPKSSFEIFIHYTHFIFSGEPGFSYTSTPKYLHTMCEDGRAKGNRTPVAGMKILSPNH